MFALGSVAVAAIVLEAWLSLGVNAFVHHSVQNLLLPSQPRTQLQTRTSRLQTHTSRLQTHTSRLQTRTSRLQTQLQTRTSRLQTHTSRLQTRTSRLQTHTSRLQTRTLLTHTGPHHTNNTHMFVISMRMSMEGLTMARSMSTMDQGNITAYRSLTPSVTLPLLVQQGTVAKL